MDYIVNSFLLSLKILESISKKLTQELQEQRLLEKADGELYEYGFQQGFQIIFNIITTIVILILIFLLYHKIRLYTQTGNE